MASPRCYLLVELSCFEHFLTELPSAYADYNIGFDRTYDKYSCKQDGLDKRGINSSHNLPPLLIYSIHVWFEQSESGGKKFDRGHSSKHSSKHWACGDLDFERGNQIA